VKPISSALLLFGFLLGCARSAPPGPEPQLAFGEVPLIGGGILAIGDPPLAVTDSTTERVLQTYWEHHFIPVLHNIQWSRTRTDSIGAVLEIILDTLGAVESVRWHYGLDVTEAQVRADLQRRFGRGRELKVGGKPFAIRWMRGRLARVLTVDRHTQLVTQWLGPMQPPRADFNADLRRLTLRCLEQPDFAVAFCSTPWRWLYD
jgi:hypothetical protein